MEHIKNIIAREYWHLTDKKKIQKLKQRLILLIK